jgi:hypothetical protein
MGGVTLMAAMAAVAATLAYGQEVPEPTSPSARLVAHIPVSVLRQAVTWATAGSVFGRATTLPVDATLVLGRLKHDVKMYAISYTAGRFAEYAAEGTAIPLVAPGSVMSGLMALPVPAGGGQGDGGDEESDSAMSIDTVAFIHGTVSDAGQVPSTLFDDRVCGSNGVSDMAEILDCLDLVTLSSFESSGAILSAAMGYVHLFVCFGVCASLCCASIHGPVCLASPAQASLSLEK